MSEHQTSDTPHDAPPTAAQASSNGGGVATAARPDATPASPQLRLEPELRKALEAILLVIDEPVGVDTLAQVLEVATDEVEDSLIALAAEYKHQGRGFVLRRAGGGWRLYTDPGAASYVERFVLHGRTGRLTQAALETLSIIAYKQPVTRAEISEIRGVDADSGVRNLLSRGLVEEIGRADTPGQPLLYGTSGSFLEKMGLDDLGELPPLPALVPDGPIPPEPAPGGYKAARKELVALGNEPAADEGLLDELDAAVDAIPGSRLTALLDSESAPTRADSEVPATDEPAPDEPDSDVPDSEVPASDVPDSDVPDASEDDDDGR